MDETLICRKKWVPYGSLPKLRWAFGLIDRDTKIPIVFYIEDKTHWRLAQITKRHAAPGSIIFTDAHSSYVNLVGQKSKFSPYGFYHFWVNHSEFYIHTKFPFCCTNRIEHCWLQLKKAFPMLFWNKNP
jgi:hypothetical protein